MSKYILVPLLLVVVIATVVAIVIGGRPTPEDPHHQCIVRKSFQGWVNPKMLKHKE